jgi:peptide-methionine (R)-S-oxide reductase
MTYEVTKTESEWKAALDPNEFKVLRQAATERPWSGALLDEHRDGVFRCRACDAELFRSTSKFDSGSGWPSFYEPVSPDAVTLKSDKAWGMTRTEVLCARCGSHLGHLFDDAPQTPTGERFCMNSVSLSFDEGAKA